MAASAPIECDVIDATSDEKLRTVVLPLVPRIGDELDLDLGERGAGDGLYRVVRVRFHVRPRKLVRTDDLFGVAIYVTPTD